MKIILVAGARPNFMKIAPLIWELRKRGERLRSKNIQYLLVHTGQHYDVEMSQQFFKDFSLPYPDVNLEVGSSSHAVQTANIMIKFNEVCLKEKPDIIVVVGDVNSTIACSLVASKLGVKIAHVEAGLRSFDRMMPEEINRILTDSISDYLFTTCRDANENLRREGIPENKIFFVGNIMIDVLRAKRNEAGRLSIHKKYNLEEMNYALLTLHRPSNVDNAESLKSILIAIRKISKYIPVLFPIHPRTKKYIDKYNFREMFSKTTSIIFTKPLSYSEFLSLMIDAKFILTDSGGIQEETTVLNIPCLTLRWNTERPMTVEFGTNKVVGNNTEAIINESMKIIQDKFNKKTQIPERWDGKTSKRIIDLLLKK